MANAFPHGTVHEAREDLQAAVQSNPKVLILWESLTALGRNEFICWVDDTKQPKTRQRRIERTCDELLEARNGLAAGQAAFIVPTKRQAHGNRQS